MRNQRAYIRCIGRLLGSYIEIESLNSLKAILRAAIVSEFSAMYPPKELRYLLGITPARVNQLAIELPRMAGENRDTHWVIRSALHDLRKHEFKSLSVSVKVFTGYICENALEEGGSIEEAIKLLKCGEKTIRGNADCSMYPVSETRKKKTKRKKKWWEK